MAKDKAMSVAEGTRLEGVVLAARSGAYDARLGDRHEDDPRGRIELRLGDLAVARRSPVASPVPSPVRSCGRGAQAPEFPIPPPFAALAFCRHSYVTQRSVHDE
ncbi:MAG TPA: hypothetical protein VFT19_05020 [Solirubrobacterales bacterium]|nr:hypothetical protein [Solirubrobacterales bacterium]